MSSSESREFSFADLNLPANLLETLSRVGYETPTPIQRRTIPPLLAGSDIVGMAQTGTGKTAAFALPILARIDVSNMRTQALVLCPTRELALQVAEAFQTYAEGMKGFHVLPVYGGQDMGRQLQALRRGAHVIVATPGRLLDHLRRKSLDLRSLQTLVLDEGDEMLRMGFIDDVEEILKQTPSERQVALFSATMPAAIKKVADRYLKNPEEIRIKTATSTNADIEQFYWLVQGTNKLDALTRLLEVEEFDGMIVFVRTRNSTVELADKLSARGFSAAALNGDMNQSLRQRTIEQLKRGNLDILVATDVAARGLDVDRISHVMNYDIPYDNEAYVHRIGRTGRAGRSGKAILFVAPRERRMLQSIERTTRKTITRMELPTRGELIERRSEAFKAAIADTVQAGNLEFFHDLVQDLCRDHECSIEDVAAAMAMLLQKDKPLAPVRDRAEPVQRDKASTRPAPAQRAPERPAPKDKPVRERIPRVAADDGEVRAKALKDFPDIPMQRFRIDVGHQDNVTPREIVGAIANEAEIEGRYIGHIRIFDSYSTVDLPDGMPEEIFRTLRKTHVCQKPLNITALAGPTAVAPIASPDSREQSPAPGQARKKLRHRDRPDNKPGFEAHEKQSGKAPNKTLNRKPGKKAAKKVDDKPRKKNRVNKDKGKRRKPIA